MSVELMSDISHWISVFVNFRNAGVSTYIIFYISYTYKIIFLLRKSNAVLFIKFKDKNTVYYFQAALNHQFVPDRIKQLLTRLSIQGVNSEFSPTLEILPSEWIFLRLSPLRGIRPITLHLMARPSGFFNSTASLKPAFAFSTATGTSTDHFSYFARTLNDHFLPPSLSFLFLRPDGPPRWIIILALLDRIFGADDLPVPSTGNARLLVRFLFARRQRIRRTIAGRESSNSNAPARLSYSRG